MRIRHRGQKHETRRFPYLPHPDEKERVRARSKALKDALAAKATEAATYHFYGKPKSQVADEQTLRDWLTAWKFQACELVEDDASHKPLTHLTPRAGAKKDANPIDNLIRIADQNTHKNKRMSLMDKRIVDLERSDFNGPNGLLRMLTGRRPKPTKDEPEPPKPNASVGTQRRALGIFGAVWNHARDEWNMEITRPWKGVKVIAQKK